MAHLPTRTSSSESDAVVVTAPDGCTKYLRSAITESLRHMEHGAVLEVPCPDPTSQGELAEWCLGRGLRLNRPFAPWMDGRLLVHS